MKRAATATALSLLMLLALPVGAVDMPTVGDWKIEGSHPIVFTCGGNEYPHTLADGFPGSGSYDPNGAYTWDMTGDISGDDLSFTIVYTGANAGYTLNGEGTIAPDGSVAGTTDGNCQTFAMEAGTATKVTPEDVMAAADSSVSGGGHLFEKDGLKRKEWRDVSFGGWIAKFGPELVGEWQVNLHNAGDDAFDGAKFHATSFSALNLFDGNSATCDDAVNFTATGTLNGEEGYVLVFRGGDNGSPNDMDTARIEIRAPGGATVYDTHAAGEFADESSCVGTARTGLDTGNLTIAR